MLARATSMFAASAIPRGACAIPAMRKVVLSDKWRHPESQQVLETVLSGLEENSKAGKSSDDEHCCQRNSRYQRNRPKPSAW